MTDEEEFSARSQLKWTREGDAWILLYRRRRMGRVVPDTDHPGMWRSIKGSGPKRYGQPELVQGCCPGSSREGGRLRACKHPLKTPPKQGVFSAKIVAHSFKRGLGPRMADYAHSGGHSHRHCPLTTPHLVAATFAAASLISVILPGWAATARSFGHRRRPCGTLRAWQAAICSCQTARPGRAHSDAPRQHCAQ